MDERDEILVNVAGQKLGEVVVAILAIVQALKNQPGFDRAAFNADIRERLARKGVEEDSLIKTILETSLDRSEPSDGGCYFRGCHAL